VPDPGFIVRQPSLFGQPEVVGFGCEAFRVELIERDKANAMIAANHYSRKVVNTSTLHLGVFLGPALVGALQFGCALNPASGGGIVEGATVDTFLELNRMWLDDRAPRNSESRALACAFRVIRRTRPQVGWIQSFADERCGRLGVVYQAANFLYCGEHDAVFWELDGVFHHNIVMTAAPETGKGGRIAAHLQANRHRAKAHTLRQFRYLYFLHKGARRRLLLPVLPYPKPEPAPGVASA
jgi:hypothetical protein